MSSTPLEDSSPPSLRDAMRQLAGGVCIVTAGVGRSIGGFTATSVTSLTLEPPCILVCVNKAVSALPVIRQLRHFGVNILADRHLDLAERFSGSGGLRGAERFQAADWRHDMGRPPLLPDALAAIDCDLEDIIERHSHLVLIGAAQGILLGPAGPPLIYGQAHYGRFEETHGSA